MRLRRLGRDCNIGAIAGCAQRNGETNSARAAADKDGLAGVLFIAIPFGDMRQRAPGSHCSAAPASEVLFSPVPGLARSPSSEHHRTSAFGFAGSGSDPAAKYWP